MIRSRIVRFCALASGLLLTAALLPASVVSAQGGSRSPDEVLTRTSRFLDKLDAALQRRFESGSTKRTNVFVVTVGGAERVLSYLDGAHVARAPRGAALIVGTVRAHELGKVASVRSVVSVGQIAFRKTGSPLGPDPELGNRPSIQELRDRIARLRANDVGFRAKVRGGRDDDDPWERNDVLDARTHGFADAWKEGFQGQGTTVAVLDGGTDFGHPDLEGTWKTGENGWPMAFDPFGTLLWLLAPSDIGLGLSWYTITEARDVSDQTGDTYTVTFATRRGPARNFSAPNETVEHDYTFPAAWTQSNHVRIGMHPDEWMLQIYEERPAVLVTDPNTAGVYDTVYVDLDNDLDFSDEKPVTQSSPASFRDMDGDGLQDMSGGLLYYISDGEDGTPLPGGPEAFGLSITAEPGELLAWSGDFDPAIGGHGTLTASNVAGQGRINGLAPVFEDLGRGRGRGSEGGTYEGAVVGGAPQTDLVPFGDIYFSFDFSTQFAYFLTNDAGVDVTTNSYGSSEVDNDGWDAASQEADIWHTAFGGRTTPLFSTGNGGAGFGTTAPPSPFTGIAVGASTQFGGTGWDSIVRTTQIVDNDVTTFSNRGPGATGANGVDVVASGAYSSGDLTLNAVGNGDVAWGTWGGTSRSAPVAGAATALIYQAQREVGDIPEGFNLRAREILKSSSEDLGYESWTQGAGSVQADDAVRAALQNDGIVSPDAWRVGDYRGNEYPVMSHLMARGQTDSQTFLLSGGGGWRVSDRVLRLTDQTDVSFTSASIGDESEYNFNAPDYLIDLTDEVRSHRDADLMVIRAMYPHEQLDDNGDYEFDQLWRLLAYNWTDVNRDRNLWTDQDGDGVVDHETLETSSNIDGFLDLDFANSEMDKGEYVRFMYNNAAHNSLQVAVRDPQDRVDDGLFLGLQHNVRSDAIPQTDFKFRIEFYENEDWDWLQTPRSASGSLSATVTVPEDAPYGMHGGAIVLSRGHDDVVVPVSVAVAPQVQQDETGKFTGNVTFGGESAAQHDADRQYNNGAMFGANDWQWRAEAGDWRFFFFDVPRQPAEGSLLLFNSKWQDEAPHTDIDTLVFGPSENEYQLNDPGPVGAPYIIDTVGASPNTNVGAGIWTFDTATGGSEDWVTAPAQEGLHALVHHQVDWEGNEFYVPFETTQGAATVNPSEVVVETAEDTGSFDVTFESTVDLPGLVAEAFGLSQAQVTTETAAQDNPDDPSTASIKRDVALEHAARATFETNLEGHDIDLFVVYDANGDGNFTPNEIVGASTSPTGIERVELVRPPDGNYQVWVHGFSVTGSPQFELAITPVQGNDMTVSGVPEGPVPAGTPVTLHVDFTKTMEPGQEYLGELQLGPSVAPTAISVPVTVRRT